MFILRCWRCWRVAAAVHLRYTLWRLTGGAPARARHHAGGHAAGHCSPPCFFSRACLTALSSWCSYDKLVKIMEQYDKDQSGGCWVGWRRGWLAGRRAELVGGDAACGGAWPDRTARAACTAGSIDFAEFLRMFRDELLDLQVAGGWGRVWCVCGVVWCGVGWVWCGVGWVCRWGGWGIEMLCGEREREREREREGEEILESVVVMRLWCASVAPPCQPTPPAPTTTPPTLTRAAANHGVHQAADRGAGKQGGGQGRCRRGRGAARGGGARGASQGRAQAAAGRREPVFQ